MGERISEPEPGVVPGPSRRTFIERSAVTAGGLVVLGKMPGATGAGTASAAADGAAAEAPTALTAAELTTLKAILARLLPVDEGGPGAVEANVHVYINRQLATAAYAEDLPAYRQNLAAINQAAQGSFAALTAQQQDSLLKRMEAGTAPGLSQSFFFTLLGHLREGMFSDPMYGGNANFAGWDLIGFPGIKFNYTVQEQAIGARVTPAHVSIASVGGKPAV